MQDKHQLKYQSTRNRYKEQMLQKQRLQRCLEVSHCLCEGAALQ